MDGGVIQDAAPSGAVAFTTKPDTANLRDGWERLTKFAASQRGFIKWPREWPGRARFRDFEIAGTGHECTRRRSCDRTRSTLSREADPKQPIAAGQSWSQERPPVDRQVLPQCENLSGDVNRSAGQRAQKHAEEQHGVNRGVEEAGAGVNRGQLVRRSDGVS
jgi:hypothetical protein